MKDKLIKRFVIGTFISLYALVSVISTIHVIDFFELSNPYWLAVTLAIGFEIGAAASLASLVILKKMNKTIVWSLFIAITLMQMQGNMYYAFINLEDYTSWSELFNLIEEDVIDQKRILAFVSGAILPLIALGFIKSLVDYIKPETDTTDESVDEISEGLMDEDMFVEDFETKPSEEFFEDIVNRPAPPKKDEAPNDEIINETTKKFSELADQLALMEDDTFEDLESVLQDGLDTIDEDHALDQVMNQMVDDLTEEDLKEIASISKEPLPTWTEETTSKESLINPSSVGSIVEKLNTSHLPKTENVLKSQDELWKEAMDKKAKLEMEAFIRNKNANK